MRENKRSFTFYAVIFVDVNKLNDSVTNVFLAAIEMSRTIVLLLEKLVVGWVYGQSEFNPRPAGVRLVTRPARGGGGRGVADGGS